MSQNAGVLRLQAKGMDPSPLVHVGSTRGMQCHHCRSRQDHGGRRVVGWETNARDNRGSTSTGGDAADIHGGYVPWGQEVTCACVDLYVPRLMDHFPLVLTEEPNDEESFPSTDVSVLLDTLSFSMPSIHQDETTMMTSLCGDDNSEMEISFSESWLEQALWAPDENPPLEAGFGGTVEAGFASKARADWEHDLAARPDPTTVGGASLPVTDEGQQQQQLPNPYPLGAWQSISSIVLLLYQETTDDLLPPPQETMTFFPTLCPGMSVCFAKKFSRGMIHQRWMMRQERNPPKPARKTGHVSMGLPSVIAMKRDRSAASSSSFLGNRNPSSPTSPRPSGSSRIHPSLCCAKKSRGGPTSFH
mmetsp:Transcript_30446/g.70153  ORF Transcript_30446/g.70153 Transcript_30446/m.70153 type:complete len:360 (-) Transcript_30446:322-1401(-)